MAIVILNEVKAFTLVSKKRIKNIDCIISINDPINIGVNKEYYDELESLMKSNCKSYLKLNFFDSESESYRGTIVNEINKLIKFANKIRDFDYKSFLFYCGNGISKSPAIAIYLLTLLSEDRNVNRCIKLIKTIKPDYKPNNLILDILKTRVDY